VSAGEDRDRETSSLVYTLGQLGCGKAELADAQVLSLLWRCQASSACYSPQGIANVYHGLAKVLYSSYITVKYGMSSCALSRSAFRALTWRPTTWALR
jgi:hypothetical protein